MPLYWRLWIALAVAVSIQSQMVPLNEVWCPPTYLKRHSGPGLMRTTVVTEIHGQIEQTGLNWGKFLAGHKLSRFFYYYIGVLGFDNVYLNVLYNDTVHSTPPTLEEIYPTATSCVASWAKTGRIILKHMTYAGPKSRWPLDKDGNPTIKKNSYRTQRGINPTFEDIKKNNRSDWVMVIDIDEMLFPLNWQPSSDRWCQSSPSLIQQGIVNILEVAQSRYLDGYINMTSNINRFSPGCPFGQSYRTLIQTPYEVFAGFAGPPMCAPIDGIVFPIRFWSTDGLAADQLPSLRTRCYVAYGKEHYFRRTVDIDSHAQNWKTMHNVATCPYLKGHRTAHDGLGFSIYAPRLNHTRAKLTFEVAHFNRLYAETDPAHLSLLVEDSSIVKLVRSYQNCIR